MEGLTFRGTLTYYGFSHLLEPFPLGAAQNVDRINEDQIVERGCVCNNQPH